MQESMAWIGQFGVAGLIAWMWLAERRAAAVREKQLTEVLLKALNDNTRALVSLESCQRGLLGALGWSLGRGAGPRVRESGGGLHGGSSVPQRGVGRSA